MSIKVFRGEEALFMMELDILESKIRSLLSISEAEFYNLVKLIMEKPHEDKIEEFITDRVSVGSTYSGIMFELTENEI